MTAGAPAACPKSMTHGPCGGVRAEGGCEVAPLPCPFVDGPVVRWTGAAAPGSAPADPLLALAGVRPIVLADLPHLPVDAASVRASAAALAGHVDAVLFGDTDWARVQLPPSYREALEAKYVAGKSVREIAALWQVTEKAVESQLTRARQAFRTAFLALARNLGTELR